MISPWNVNFRLSFFSGMHSVASENCALDVRGSRVYTALVAADNAPTSVCTMHTAPSYTVNMADSDGNVTTVTGSVLNYQRELIEGHDEIVVEDAWKMEAARSALVAPSLISGWISVLANTPQRAAIGYIIV